MYLLLLLLCRQRSSSSSCPLLLQLLLALPPLLRCQQAPAGCVIRVAPQLLLLQIMMSWYNWMLLTMLLLVSAWQVHVGIMQPAAAQLGVASCCKCVLLQLQLQQRRHRREQPQWAGLLATSMA